jgi:undecaprenyl pyrophosphate synthase
MAAIVVSPFSFQKQRRDQSVIIPLEAFTIEPVMVCAIVFCLWTHHIQEDINASRLFRHAIEVHLHSLLVKRVYLRGIGNAAVLVNILSHLLNRAQRTTRKKDDGTLCRKFFGYCRPNSTTCAKNDGVLVG